ncbi:heme-dependent oxidative N-demethylase subunit alpha family protein [Deinococcus pimensis]|uniref:heme-dependent oxidative N-demethylase subunit alpha family protein n=1 Tax=Deinococcus pimensis TaxID=309888 RepID=UPI0004856403|nr:heme-dependent oxidative N-demethylase subunit alpha family protein [Deinococcus pimensis]
MTPLPDAAPPVYTPFEHGRYDVTPGLLVLGRHAVQGRAESHVYAFDRQLPEFVRAKVEVRARLHLHYVQAALPPDLRRAALEAFLAPLARDSGGAVTWDGQRLANAWLGWSARLDLERGSVEGLRRKDGPLAHLVREVEPRDALDFIALNVPEDLTVVARDPATQEDWQAALHVCFPQGWDPRDKVGRSFAAVHAPVGGAGALLSAASRLTTAMTTKGPFVRFAWGLHASGGFGAHPALVHEEVRDFDPSSTWLRVERQTLAPLPGGAGAVFTIRPYLTPLLEVADDPSRRERLALALVSMKVEHLRYKGMTSWRDDVVAWLRGDHPGR